MKYTELITQGMKEKKLNLRQTAEMITKECGLKIDYSYLSKLKNGSKPPASDRMNEALAEVLEIDSLDLKTAAYSEKIPNDVLEKLKEPNRA